MALRSVHARCFGPIFEAASGPSTVCSITRRVFARADSKTCLSTEPLSRLTRVRTRLSSESLANAKSYVGDQHVWRWYRGNAVGPNLCFSALLALERVCDQLIAVGGPIATIVSILLDGCENLAMVGFVVGLLVRHLENAEDLLDPYLTEPFAWEQEFVACSSRERSRSRLRSEHLVAPERRKWSLQDAAMFMVYNCRRGTTPSAAHARRPACCQRASPPMIQYATATIRRSEPRVRARRI